MLKRRFSPRLGEPFGWAAVQPPSCRKQCRSAHAGCWQDCEYPTGHLGWHLCPPCRTTNIANDLERKRTTPSTAFPVLDMPWSPGEVAKALDAMEPPREVAGQYRVRVVKRPRPKAPLLVGEADDPDGTADPNLAAHLVGEAEIAGRVPEPPPAAGPPAGVLVLRADGASGSRAWPQAPVSGGVSIGSLSYRCSSTGCLLPLPPPPRAALANAPRPAEHRVGLGGSWLAGKAVEDGVFQEEVGDRLLVAELQRLLEAPAAEKEEKDEDYETEEDDYVPSPPYTEEAAKAAERAHAERLESYRRMASAWNEAAAALEEEDEPRAAIARAAAQAESVIINDRICNAADAELGRPQLARHVPKEHNFTQHLTRKDRATAYRGLARAWLASVTELEWGAEDAEARGQAAAAPPSQPAMAAEPETGPEAGGGHGEQDSGTETECWSGTYSAASAGGVSPAF